MSRHPHMQHKSQIYITFISHHAWILGRPQSNKPLESSHSQISKTEEWKGVEIKNLKKNVGCIVALTDQQWTEPSWTFLHK